MDAEATPPRIPLAMTAVAALVMLASMAAGLPGTSPPLPASPLTLLGAALGWLALQLVAAWWWTEPSPPLAPAGPQAAVGLKTLVAALHGGLAALPQLLPTDPARSASLALVAVMLALGLSATVRSAPGAARWCARALLAGTLLGAASAAPGMQLALLGLAWLCCEAIALTVSGQEQALVIARAGHAQATQALAAKSAELKEATSSRIRILGTVSHEIRQPVHALGMMVERLRIDPSPTEFRGQVDEISAVVRSLAHSLAMLLDISRLDAGTVNVKIGSESLDVLMDRLRREFAVDAKRKNITLDCASDVDLKIETDLALFYSAVANFVSNAIRYTDRGEVKVFATRRNAQELWIHVADTGRGIPQDKLTDIFIEYVRLDREHQSAQGFGLGLAIVKRTAELLGLALEVDSRPGMGSEFRISVPISSRQELPGPRSTTMARPSMVSRSLVGLRVVLVDNDESVLRGMNSMVRSWGCLPLPCQSVAELRAKLGDMRGEEVDCIIADYHLGVGIPNGLDAIDLVRQCVPGHVSATLFTGDLSIRPGDLRLADVRVAHKPVVPARTIALLEEMAAETRRHRQPAPESSDTPSTMPWDDAPAP